MINVSGNEVYRERRHFSIVFGLMTIIILAGVGILTAVVDPWFHFHGPISTLQYKIFDERHQNPGITSHFEYDAIITGTSMTEYFKASEVDELWGMHSIKVPFSGGTYKEISDNIYRGSKNHNIQLVIRSLDERELIKDKDRAYEREGYEYPYYLIDNNPFNDVEYLFNSEVFVDSVCDKVIRYTLRGHTTSSFDECINWTPKLKYGRTIALEKYKRPELVEEEVPLSDDEKTMLIGNVSQNIIGLAKQMPDTEFYYFVPPYSVLEWDKRSRSGRINYWFDVLEIEYPLLLQQDNIHLFAFSNRYDIVENLDYYKDSGHYCSEINSEILRCMRNGENEITMNNYRQYIEELRAFYGSYDYDSIFE